MLSELNRLLSPFKRGFALYILCTLLRQGLVVGGGYDLVLLIRSYEHNSAQSALMALGVLLAYKLVLDSLDQAMGWKFAKNQGWHQSGSSGARRGEITNGLSKFAQTTVVTHRLSAIDGLVDEVVAFSQGRVAGRYAGEGLIAFTAQPFAVPIA
jgi:hypothetical protein